MIECMFVCSRDNRNMLDGKIDVSVCVCVCCVGCERKQSEGSTHGYVD